MANISSYLNTIRTATSGESVRTAIANALTAINQDNPVTVQGKTITANGTYTAEGGIAFNPVTVQVPDGGAKDYNFIDIEIVENGEYPKAEDKAKNTYYDKVTVAVPQFANDLMEERKITKNGEYEALLDGYDGYAKVIVDVSGIDTDTYTCTFVDENGTPLRTVPNIPSGGWCSDNGLRPASATGKPFQGWNPAPNDIRYNIICKPTYYETQLAVGEIVDDWATIVANKGEPYAIGAYKTLPLNITGQELFSPSPDSGFVPGDGTIVAPMAASITQPIMMKVANGEDMSTSTWISVAAGVSGFNSSIFQRSLPMDQFYWDSFSWMSGYRHNHNWLIVEEVGKRFGWPTCMMRHWLNNDFLANIPDFLRQALVPVIKKSRTVYMDAGGTAMADTNTETLDTIWVPSVREMCTDADTSGRSATSGIKYTDFQNMVHENGQYDWFFPDTNCLTCRDVFPAGAWNDGVQTYKGKTYRPLTNGAFGWNATYSTNQIMYSGNLDASWGSSYSTIPIGFCL